MRLPLDAFSCREHEDPRKDHKQKTREHNTEEQNVSSTMAFLSFELHTMDAWYINMLWTLLLRIASARVSSSFQSTSGCVMNHDHVFDLLALTYA
jgi:hypothetical protein